VVEVGAASLAVHDTLGIELENSARGVNGDAGWLLVDGGLDLGDALLWNNRVALHSNLLLGSLSLACSVSAGVAVVGFELDFGLLSILEGPNFKTAIAAFVAALGAINKLLLRKLQKLTGLDGVRALHGSDGGEGPAGAAGGLVLDGVDGALSSPVDLIGHNGGVEVFNLGVVWEGWLLSLEFVVLLLRQGGEQVVANNEAVWLGVELIDDLVIFVIDLESELEFFFGTI